MCTYAFNVNREELHICVHKHTCTHRRVSVGKRGFIKTHTYIHTYMHTQEGKRGKAWFYQDRGFLCNGEEFVDDTVEAFRYMCICICMCMYVYYILQWGGVCG